MYTPSQIDAWTRDLAPERYIQAIENLEFYISASEDRKGRISGLLIFSEDLGEIYALYVAPWAAREGLGRCFIDFAEKRMRSRDHTTIHLKSTLNAVSFYEHMGFECTGDSIHELQNGEKLPCMQMTKKLV
jgi:putative acetyltransferase